MQSSGRFCVGQIFLRYLMTLRAGLRESSFFGDGDLLLYPL